MVKDSRAEGDWASAVPSIGNTAGFGRTEQHASCDGRPCTHWLRVVRVRENLVATGKAVRESLQQRARGNIRVLVADRQAPTTPSFMLNCLLRRPLCLLRAGAEEAVELASPRQAAGCIRATHSYLHLRCEAQVHTLMPCGYRLVAKARSVCSLLFKRNAAGQLADVAWELVHSAISLASL